MMTKCERAILFFLVKDTLEEYSEWAYQQSKGDRRELLDKLVTNLRLEDEKNEKEKA